MTRDRLTVSLWNWPISKERASEVAVAIADFVDARIREAMGQRDEELGRLSEAYSVLVDATSGTEAERRAASILAGTPIEPEATAHKTSGASPNELYREGENDNDGLSQDDLLRSKDTPGRPMPVEALSQPAPVGAEARWRVGRKLGRTLYLDGRCVGMVDTPDLARQIVDALNDAAAPSGESPCIVCHQPVMDIGPKSSIPGRNGWAHTTCAAAPSEDAEGDEDEPAPEPVREETEEHRASRYWNIRPVDQPPPAPVERSEGPSDARITLYLTDDGSGALSMGDGHGRRKPVDYVRASDFDELAEALRRLRDFGARAWPETDAILAKFDAARGKAK